MKNSFFIQIFFIVACEKDELPIQPHAVGDEEVNTVEIGEYYKNQVFFNLEQNEVISSNEKTEWDLAFECVDIGWRIRLNTAKGMAIAKSTNNFETTLDTIGAVWNWDAHSGNQDSTAIGDWQNFNGIYIVDRGYNELGLHQGFSKLKIVSFNDVSYEILYGDLSSTSPSSKSIAKNDLFANVYFNMASGNTINIAPEKTQWDIVFTQYTHIFDGPEPYLVTGVLINPYNTEVAIVTDLDFSEILYEDILNLQFSSHANAIGYDWKYFDFGASLYIVDATKNFIIKTQNGYYYKFHFVDFYNDSGIKGYPKFEFQQL